MISIPFITGGRRMNKIYTYFCLLFIGSILPFMIVEFYFQNYITAGILVLIAIIILTLSLSIDYLIKKVIQMLDTKNKIFQPFDWTKKKRNLEKPHITILEIDYINIK